MSRFRSLSEALKYQVSELLPETRIPTASPLGIQFGTALPVENTPVVREDDVQRWGFSTWGVEPITGVYRPEDEYSSEDDSAGTQA